MARFDLTDAEWAVIEPLVPTDVRGKERVDDRRVRKGIFWRLRTGAPWATSRRATARIRPAATAFDAGASAASGIGFWRLCRRLTRATCS
jgi:transposase